MDSLLLTECAMLTCVLCHVATLPPLPLLPPPPQVREFEASSALFAESKAKRSELSEAMADSQGELAALRGEMDLQRQILDKLREGEKSLDKEVDEVIAERRKFRELMVRLPAAAATAVAEWLAGCWLYEMG